MSLSKKKKQAITADQWLSLPEDLLFDIFTARLLSGEAIRACRRVCKTWRSFIVKHFGFINHGHDMVSDNGTRVYMCRTGGYTRTRLYLYSFNGCSNSLVQPTELQFSSRSFKELVGYCNGLACILQWSYSKSRKKHRRYDIFLWNPLINTIQFAMKARKICVEVVVGFGFLPQTMDYKVVTLVQNKKSGFVYIQVYSLISDTWKTISMTAGSTYCKLPHPDFHSPNTFVKGCAHWIVNRKRRDRSILCFNMLEEVFHEIDMPAVKSSIGSGGYRLTSFRDSLALFVSGGYRKLEVWVMKEHGIADSWSMLYRLTTLDFYHAYEIMDNGKILEIIRWSSKPGYSYYDPETEERTELK